MTIPHSTRGIATIRAAFVSLQRYFFVISPCYSEAIRGKSVRRAPFSATAPRSSGQQTQARRGHEKSPPR